MLEVLEHHHAVQVRVLSSIHNYQPVHRQLFFVRCEPSQAKMRGSRLEHESPLVQCETFYDVKLRCSLSTPKATEQITKATNLTSSTETRDTESEKL